jgi:hypothetical protein
MWRWLSKRLNCRARSEAVRRATPQSLMKIVQPVRVQNKITQRFENSSLSRGLFVVGQPLGYLQSSRARISKGGTTTSVSSLEIAFFAQSATGLRSTGSSCPTPEKRMDNHPAFMRHRFVPFACSTAAATTASTVKPNFFTSFCRGADAPKVRMPMRAPSNPT